MSGKPLYELGYETPHSSFRNEQLNKYAEQEAQIKRNEEKI